MITRTMTGAAIFWGAINARWADEGGRSWDGDLIIGPAVVLSTNPFAGAEDDLEASAVPFIYFENDWLTAGFDGLSLKLIENDWLGVRALAQPRYLFVEPEDEPALSDIDRQITLDLGASVRVGPENLYLETVVRKEVTSEHEGLEIEAGFHGSRQIGETNLNLVAGARWQDKKLSSYLYGVRPEEATADRLAYTADDDVTPFVSAQVMRPLRGKWVGFAGVNVDFLPDVAKDSPIIDADNIVTTMIGAFYVF